MSELPLLELLRPPEDRWFAGGLCVTHDLNTASLVELALPTLAGLEVAELEARRGAWGSLAVNCLTVACAADRASYRAPVPADVVEILPVAGRRLHAKYMILQYDALPGQGSGSLTRVVVTSANLTHAGLTRNREVWALHEITSRDAGRASVARDLLEATEAMARELPTEQRTSLLRRTRELREHMPQLRRARAIRHSLTTRNQGSLLGGLPRPSRLVILSPPFAAGSAKQAIQALSPLLHEGLRLDLYVGTNLSAAMLRQGTEVSFLPSLAEELANRCVFRLYAVPGLVGQGADELRRMMHAKAVIAFYEGGHSRMWVGSANLTGRGLGGRNRELLLEVDAGGSRDAQAFVNTLPAIEVDVDRLVAPPAEAELRVVVRATPPLRCVFRPEPGTHAAQTFVAGELRLVGDLSQVRRLWMRGDRLRVMLEQPVQLAMDAPWVRAVFAGSSKEVELLVSIQADDKFWEPARLDADDDGRLPRDLRLLLMDLRRAAKRSTTRLKTSEGGDPGRFDLPYDRRLPNVVRMLRRLAVFDDADLEQRLAEYLEDRVELNVAIDLLASIRGSVNAKDPAVRALQRLMADG